MRVVEKGPVDEAEQVVRMIGDRARNLYASRQLFCSEAVLTALNHGLGGGLTDAQILAVAAPFGDAMGDSGCICGALAGAVMGVGVLLCDGHPYRHRKMMRTNARYLHDAFRERNGATCCRVISGNRNDSDAFFAHCAEITGQAAEMAAKRICSLRPELIHRADAAYLSRLPSSLYGRLLRMVRFAIH